MRTLALLACLTAATLVVTASAQPFSAVDGRGKRITLRAAPQRIVSLIPSDTEILFALGLKGRIVADTALCDYPAEAKSLPHIGDFTTSVERVTAMRPDLVVGTMSANRVAIERIESMRRTPVFTVDAETFPELYAQIRELGRITGQTRQADTLVADMKARTEAVKRAVATDRQRPRVLFALNIQPLWVAGSSSFIEDMIEQAGGINIASGTGKGYHALSVERMISMRPDVIFTYNMMQQKLKHAGMAGMPAVMRGQVHPLGDEAVRPGPRLVNALEHMARLLHPQCFKSQ